MQLKLTKITVSLLRKIFRKRCLKIPKRMTVIAILNMKMTQIRRHLWGHVLSTALFAVNP